MILFPFDNLLLTTPSEVHLKLYHERHRDYLEALVAQQALRASSMKGQQTLTPTIPVNPIPFSAPDDPNGYNDTAISGDMVTELYTEFVATCRQAESERLHRMHHDIFCPRKSNKNLERKSDLLPH